ncbi:MAG: P1 family peptidase [Phycisphaerales bacterium]|nr:P1 family peptidase [Phycisphaerales bacterium]
MNTQPTGGCISDVPGVHIGHAHSESGHTGVTVLLFESGAIAGIDIGGSAPATRETELLNPTNMIMRIHAILLTGGSTFGLGAAAGVQRFLQEKDIGFRASTGVVVPIVPTAAIFDLDVGRPRIYPDAQMGYDACRNAKAKPTRQGSIGAGSGALCGKVLGTPTAMRGGVGTASITFPDGLTIGALAVCNAWGDVLDPDTGSIVAGARDPDAPERFLNTDDYLIKRREIDPRFFGRDTTLCVVATNAKFSREQITKLAMMAQDGIARAVRPSHTMFDGDVVFAVSLGDKEVDVNVAGSIAARMIVEAINRGVREANKVEPTK